MDRLNLNNTNNINYQKLINWTWNFRTKNLIKKQTIIHCSIIKKLKKIIFSFINFFNLWAIILRT